MSSTDVRDHKCEICGGQATAGMIDKITIRYACQDHYMQLYEEIARDNSER